ASLQSAFLKRQKPLLKYPATDWWWATSRKGAMSPSRFTQVHPKQLRLLLLGCFLLQPASRLILLSISTVDQGERVAPTCRGCTRLWNLLPPTAISSSSINAVWAVLAPIYNARKHNSIFLRHWMLAMSD